MSSVPARRSTSRAGVSEKSLLVIGILVLVAGAAGAILAPQFGVLGLVFLAVGVGVLLVLHRPALGLYLVAFAIPLENMVVLGDSVTWVRAIGIVALLAWVMGQLVHRRPWAWILSQGLVIPAALYTLLAFASLLWAQDYASGLQDVVTLASLLVMSLLVIGVVDSKERLSWVMRSLILGGLVAAGITIYQFLMSQDIGRAGENVAGGVNQTGAVMVLLIPIAFHMLRQESSRLWRLFGLVFAIAGPLAAVMTVSRLSMLLLGFVLALQLWDMGRGRRSERMGVVIIGLMLGAVLIAAAPWEMVIERGSTITSVLEEITSESSGDATGGENRLQHWRGGMAMFNDHPLLGVGYGNFGYQFLTYQFEAPGGDGRVYYDLRSPHSSFFGILSELGLLGIALWIWLMLLAFLNLTRSISGSNQAGDRFLTMASKALLFGLLAYALYSVASTTHHHKLLWILLGLSAAIMRLAPEASPESTPTPEDAPQPAPTRPLPGMNGRLHTDGGPTGPAVQS